MELKGVMPAVVTPYDDDGAFSAGRFGKLLEHVYGAGVDGIYVCGQTGEGMQQSPEQRKRVAEVAVELSPAGKAVMIHVGAYSLDDAVGLARHASRIGAHAISSLPPLTGHSFPEIRKYYETLAAASDVPLLVYYFPDLCPAIGAAAQILELTSIPNVAGLKFTDYDLFKMWTVKQAGPVIFNGRDEVFAAGLLMGADGGIGSFYNLVPAWFVEVYRLAKASRWEEARAVQSRISELIRVALQLPAMPALRSMLAWAGVPCGPALGPKVPLTSEQETLLRTMLDSAGLTDSVFPRAAVS